jgi:hypothetical protein
VVAKITELIDKFDSFEIVRDEIAAILALEKENQKVLAAAAQPAQLPELYDFDVFVERFHPWELLEDANGQPTGSPPIVNVFFDTTAEDSNSGTADGKSFYKGIFNIDCYGAKNTKEIAVGNHVAGDELTTRESQRIARLVRNIFAFNEYYRLGIPDIVNNMRIRQLDSLQPNIQDRPSNNVLVTRITLDIEYTELNFSTVPATLDLIANQCIRQDDGLIYFKADFS